MQPDRRDFLGYNRVVQAGTMQGSGAHFQKAVEIVRSGKLGKITFCRTWTHQNLPASAKTSDS